MASTSSSWSRAPAATLLLASFCVAGVYTNAHQLALEFLERNVWHGVFADTGFGPIIYTFFWLFLTAPFIAHRYHASMPVLFLCALLAAPGAIMGSVVVIESLPVLIPVGAALGLVTVVAAPRILRSGKGKGKGKRQPKKDA